MAKKGIHHSSETEIKSGQHVSPKTEFKKGQIPWNKGLKFLKWKLKDYQLPPLSKEQKAYLAGFFDGEGWITYRLDWKPTNNRTVVLGIGQKEKVVLEIIQSWLKVERCLTRDKHGQWSLQLTSKRQVMAILKAILPYLIVKRGKAKEAIKYLENKLRYVTKSGLTIKRDFEGSFTAGG